MSRKHVGGKCCPAGRAKPRSDNPLLARFYSIVHIGVEQNDSRWKLNSAATLNRRLLVGSGDVAASLPLTLAAWERSIGGKPRTKAQKRAARAARKQREKQA
jgi:hypothetical protein